MARAGSTSGCGGTEEASVSIRVNERGFAFWPLVLISADSHFAARRPWRRTSSGTTHPSYSMRNKHFPVFR